MDMWQEIHQGRDFFFEESRTPSVFWGARTLGMSFLLQGSLRLALET